MRTCDFQGCNDHRNVSLGKDHVTYLCGRHWKEQYGEGKK
jgi:hypothetical protein